MRQVVDLFLSGADRDKLDPILDACVAVYVDRLDEDGQVDFKGKAKAFTRTYGFLSSILAYKLMLHGAKERETPLRVLVLPEAPASETRKALGRVEISVLTFDWVESRPVFARRDLRRVLMKV